ncbi:MAG: hypothetical protein IPM33_10205 [Phycisphaerales bacterium]|nr:hypothetical protein [Phycisphaerales bacterium]
MPQSTNNYIPRPDAAFAAWVNQYTGAVEQWWADQGFDPAELNALTKALTDWNVAFAAHTAAQAAAQGARQTKDQARALLEKEVRPVTNFVQANPLTTNAARAEMGITVRDTSPTPAPAPTSRPLALVESGQRLTHRLRLVDESTPTRRARPRGVQRAEVFLALTAPGSPAPATPPIGDPGGGDYHYIGSITRGETTLSFEASKGGLQAHYLSRWVSTSGAAGPWSETASATVAA